MAAWFTVASIALMTAFCAWVLAGIARTIRDERKRKKDDRR
jgi:ABC-type nickel/cobalt efflux system permease component RcnA